MSTMTPHRVDEVLPPQVPSLPRWPVTPEPVDGSGRTFLVIAFGGDSAAAEVARGWVEEAEQLGPTTLALLDDVDEAADRQVLEATLARARTGVRLMVVGGQYDVLQTLARLRRAGALEKELRSFVTGLSEIPVFCAHCQTIFRARTAPGGETACAGCERTLSVHEHLAVLHGSFLASDTKASVL